MEDEPPPAEVVLYQAVITIELEQSSLTISPDVSQGHVVRAIVKPPQWTLHPWRAPAPEHVPLEVPRTLLEEWALHKFKALFDFAAVLPDGTAAEMEQHLQERFPLVASARLVPPIDAVAYKRIRVHSEILENGDAQWGFDLPEAGVLPPGVPGVYASESDAPLDMNAMADSHLTDLDVFVQNTVRIDIQRRLETR